MYARSTTIRGNATKLEDAVAHMRDEILPQLQEMNGFIGLSMLADRETGRCIATSAWGDELSMRASADRVHPMRERIVQIFGGEPEVQEWEIAVLHRAHETRHGSWARLTWTRGDPAEGNRMLELYRSNLMPRIEQMPGFCSLSLLVDRNSGLAVGTSTVDDRSALDASREQARSLREESVRTMNREMVDVAEMELVLAHLRVPETV